MRASGTTLALVAAAVLASAGCKNPSQNNKNVNKERRPRSFVVGRVVDDFTREPLDATVTICGVASTRTDRDGSFELVANDVDLLDSEVGVRVQSPDHAAVEFSLTDAAIVSGPAADSGDRVADLGVIRMVAGAALTVRIVDGGPGNPVTGTSVVAVLESYVSVSGDPLTGSIGDAPELGSLGCREEARGTSDAAGEVVFPNLDPYATYRFTLLSADPVGASSPACSFLFSMFDPNDADGDNGGAPDLFDADVELDVTNCVVPQAP